MRYFRLIACFGKASLLADLAYRANFWINLLHSLLNLVTGVLGIAVLFSQVEVVRGWTFAGALAILGVYLTVGALRELFMGPSLESLAGMEGDVWTGTLDFTLLRPVHIQFLASFRKWHFFALFDLLLGLGVIGFAAAQSGQALAPDHLAAFLLTLTSSMVILYAILLAFAALVFWSPGILFTWIFDGVFQLARYPLGLYPGWVRLVLTWVVPVGMVTTVPAEALLGVLSLQALAASLLLAVFLVIASSLLFRTALKRYASASS